MIPGSYTLKLIACRVLGREVLGFIHTQMRHRDEQDYQDEHARSKIQDALTKLKPYTARLKADPTKQKQSEQTLTLLQQHFEEDLTNDQLAEMTN